MSAKYPNLNIHGLPVIPSGKDGVPNLKTCVTSSLQDILQFIAEVLHETDIHFITKNI